MADSKFALRGAVSSPRSSPPNCAICLGACSNKCYSDSCMHEFCFTCLLEWSKIKAECPLCKQTFKSIIHNIKSLEEYDEHIVENTITVEENHYNLEANNIMQLLRSTPPLTALHHQYHFRTTLTVDTHGEHAIQQMLLSHPLLLGAYPPQRYPRRHRNETPASFRRSVYEDNLWVHSPPDITGRYREATPDYYRRNQTARTRLVPWLNRELNVLLHNNTQQVMLLVDIIMDNLLQIHICSASFRRLLREHLHDKADHFIHEFYNFMRSPLDMIGYDRHVIYTGRPQSPLPDVDNVPQIDISDYDSDVVLVDLTSSTTNTNNNEDAPLQDGGAAVIDLVETDSDEPILISEEQNLSYDSHLDAAAGPSTSSGITNAPRRLTDYVKKQENRDDDDTSTLTNDSDNNDVSTAGLGASASADNNHNSGVLNREQRCLMPVKMRFKNTKSAVEFLDNSATTSLNIDNNNSDEDRISSWPPRRTSGGRRLKIHGGKNLHTMRRQLREAQRKRTAAYLAATASTSGGPSSSRLGRQADLDSIFTSPEDSSDDSDSDPSFSDSSTSSMSSSSSGSEYRRNYRHKKLKKPSSSAASQSRNKRKNKRTPTKKDDTNNNTTSSSSGRKKDKKSKSSSHKSRTSTNKKTTGARKRLRSRNDSRSRKSDRSDSDSDNDSSRSCHKSNNDRDSDVPLSNLAAGCSTVNNRRKRKCEPIKKSAAKRAKKQETTVPTESVDIATTSTTTTRNNNPGTSDNVDGIMSQFLAVANRNSPEKITVLSESSSCSSDSPLINYYVPPPPTQPAAYVEPSTNRQPSSFSKLIRNSPQPSSSQNNNVGSNNDCGNFAVGGDDTSGGVALNNTLPSGGLYRHHNMPLSSGRGGFWQQFVEHGHGSNNNNNNNTSSSLYAVDSFSSHLPTPYFNPATLSAVANYHSNNNIPTALPTTFLDRHGNPRHHHHFNNNNNNNNVVNNNLVVNSNNNNNNNNNGCYSNLPAINLACHSNQPMSTTISITQRNNNNNNGTFPISTTPPIMEGGRNIVPQNFLANFYVNNTQNDSSSNGPNQSGEIRGRNLFQEIRAEMRAADDQSRAAARFEGTSGYFDRRNLPEIFDSARERQLQNDEQKRQRQQQNDNNDSSLCREISDDDDGNSRGSCSSHVSTSDSSGYKEYSKPNVKSRVQKPQQPQSQSEKDGVKSSAEFLENSQKKYRKGASRTDLAGSTGDGRKSSGGAARKSSKSGATNSTRNINNNNNRNSDENIDDNKKSGTHSTKNKNTDENNHKHSNSVDDEKTDCHKSNSDKLAASSSASKAADRASDGASCSGPSKSACEAPFPGASTSTRLRTVLKKEGSGFWYSRPPAVNHEDDDDDSGEDSDYQIVCH